MGTARRRRELSRRLREAQKVLRTEKRFSHPGINLKNKMPLNGKWLVVIIGVNTSIHDNRAVTAAIAYLVKWIAHARKESFE